MSNENWKWVIGFEGLYEVSDMGRVKSYKGMGRMPKLQITPRLIKPCKDGRGYYNFSVRNGSKYMVLYIHIEAAKSFIPNPNNLKFVRHLNDIKSDNAISNLAWGNHSDNMQDAIRNKVNPTKHYFGDGLILFMYNAPYSACSIARRYNVSPSMVTKIRTGRAYAWLTRHKKN